VLPVEWLEKNLFPHSKPAKEKRENNEDSKCTISSHFSFLCKCTLFTMKRKLPLPLPLLPLPKPLLHYLEGF